MARTPENVEATVFGLAETDERRPKWIGYLRRKFWSSDLYSINIDYVHCPHGGGVPGRVGVVPVGLFGDLLNHQNGPHSINGLC